MTEWNDGRLDDLSDRVGKIDQKVDEGFIRMDAKFERLERKMDEGFTRMDAKFARVDAKFDASNARFEALHMTLFRASWAMIIGLLGLLGVLIGVIATH